MVSLSDPDLDKPAVIGAAVSGGILVLYFLLTTGTGQPTNAIVFLLLVLGAGSAAWGAFGTWGRLTALWTAAPTLCILGVITLTSIGLPLFVAGLLCGVSAVRALPSLLAGR
jgi:hypothetical protein